ncbi:MAG: AI-2E family transporter [Actinomycetota bacterium]|nr:AI-2E family transporter [Actinomycetota bacterium]
MAIRKPKIVAPPPELVYERDADDAVPHGVKVAGAWAWRILAILAVLAAFVFLVIQLKYIVVPLLVALLLGALLVPFSSWLQRHRWPKWLAITTAMVATIGVVTGLIIVVVTMVRRGFPELQDRSVQAYEDFIAYLATSPFELDEGEISAYLTQAWEAIQRDSQWLVSGALSVGSTAGHVLAGALLALFATLFFLIDGPRIWAWVVRLFPKRARPAVNGGGHAGWITLTTFVKVQIFVAFVDAVGIGVGMWLVGVFAGGLPFALVVPVAVAVFLGSFIPVVGALLSGTLAVFVVLVFLGPVPAVFMLGIVLLVQQVEGHVLQPLVLGSAVKVHPLAVVFAVAAGGFIAGIPGALFAVPFIATLNVVVKYIAGGDWRTNPRPTAKELLTDV